MIGDETFAVLEANSVHFGSYYIYRSGGPGELVYDELKLTPSAGVPENVWGEVVDAEYFSLIDADHIFFFSDDGRAGDTGNLAVWKNMKAVKAGNVYLVSMRISIIWLLRRWERNSIWKNSRTRF